jgi:ABC-2 type transport system ATP-binding protein
LSDTVEERAISARRVSKSFPVTRPRPGRWGRLRTFLAPIREQKEVVRDINLDVAHGEFVSLLGPNGAGKSTTIKLLTGILTPTAGELWVDGRVPTGDRKRNAQAIGVVFGQRSQLWWDLPALESFRVLRDVYGVPGRDFDRRLREFDRALELSSFWLTPVRHLSLGQRVRCDLAAAMLHDPRVVFLDEPTIGMDVVAKEQVRELLRNQVARRERTVVLTTHDMGEISRLTERVVLLNHGTVAFDGTLNDLRRRYEFTATIRVTLANAGERPAFDGVRVTEWDGHRATMQLGPGESPQGAIRTLLDRYTVTDLSVEEADLDALIAAVYRSTDGVRSAYV